MTASAFFQSSGTSPTRHRHNSSKIITVIRQLPELSWVCPYQGLQTNACPICLTLSWSSSTEVMSSLLQTSPQVSAVWRLGFVMASLTSKDGGKRRPQPFPFPCPSSPGPHPSQQQGHIFPRLPFAAVRCLVVFYIPHQIQLQESFGFPNLSCIFRQHLHVPPGSSDPAFNSCMFPFYDWVVSGGPCSYHVSFVYVLKKSWPDIQCHCSRTDLINAPISHWYSNFSLLHLLSQHLLIFNILKCYMHIYF